MTYFLPAADAVASAARGLALAHPGQIEVHRDPLYLLARSSNPGRTVALVSGGGSGHEPLHTGLLGPGGLDAVCPGEIFASPHNRQIYEAGTAAAKANGVLLIIKNYTGDVINFRIAAERLRHDGIPVATVLVDDDLATDSKDTATGRRGTAATVVLEKLLGARADQGAKLEDLATLGTEIVARSRSLAVAARAQTPPSSTEPAFDLAPGALEYGVGIHGERGTRTIDQRPVEDLVAQMADELLQALPSGPEKVLALVNGLGATTSLELHAIGSILHDLLRARGAPAMWASTPSASPTPGLSASRCCSPRSPRPTSRRPPRGCRTPSASPCADASAVNPGLPGCRFSPASDHQADSSGSGR
jgi:dihydroxyacetone kinase